MPPRRVAVRGLALVATADSVSGRLVGLAKRRAERAVVAANDKAQGDADGDTEEAHQNLLLDEQQAQSEVAKKKLGEGREDNAVPDLADLADFELLAEILPKELTVLPVSHVTEPFHMLPLLTYSYHARYEQAIWLILLLYHRFAKKSICLADKVEF